MARPHVVLIGAGHAHLHVAANARMFIERGIDLTLIDPGRLWYSGMAAGMLAGRYEPDEASIDPEPLVTRAGGRRIGARVGSLDRASQTLWLGPGDTIRYDLLSINIGSEARDAGRFAEAWSVKPISNLLGLRDALNDRLTESLDEPTRTTVIGGGPTGCEIAANVAALAQRRGVRHETTILQQGKRLVPSHTRLAARSIERVLRRRGVACRYGITVDTVERNGVLTATGERIEANLVIAATGLRASTEIERWGLGDAAGMPVNASLRCTHDPRLFGAGDCIAFGPRPLPKVGVFGVRQGPILLHNLIAAARGDPLKPYRPQKKYLTILDLGQGIGCAMRGGLHCTGRASRWWKQRLDRAFIERYR